MKVVILGGGLGTRLAEETTRLPKPMSEIGGRPILWHIMNMYAAAGLTDFLVAAGYPGEMIASYFAEFHLKNSDWSFHLADGSRQLLDNRNPDWNVSVIHTGLETLTGGRVLRLRPRLDESTFMVTYGDGVSNVDLRALLAFHRKHGKVATVTAVRPPARFGELVLAGDTVQKFSEKPLASEGWINGGFFVFEPAAFDYLGDEGALEGRPLEELARQGELMAYRHDGFWHTMDMLRDKRVLEELWASGKAPWRTWA